jgi:integrase
MRAPITQRLIASLKPAATEFDVHDTKLTGLILRVYPSGKTVWAVQYARGKRHTLGRADLISVDEARSQARNILANGPPTPAPPALIITLAEFLNERYSPWVLVHRKDAAATLARINAHFSPDQRLDAFTPAWADHWRTQRLQAGISKATVNRDLVALKAALSKAVEWEVLPQHPLARFKPLSGGDTPKTRYLSTEEETRLRKAMDQREEELRQGRESGNQWRRERGYPAMEPLVDYLKPMVLVSLNTGIRQGELFSMTWADLDLETAMLTVRSENAKSGKTRYIPLNTEALETLQHWRRHTSGDGLVFPSATGGRRDNIQKAWTALLKAAGVENFRHHDIRHTFASRLVTAGVDLNTVRELLGHGDLKMTLRYAHLAPAQRRAAVDKLCG